MKALVVDDHRLIVDDIIDELKSLSPDITCMGCTDPEEALSLFRKHGFDVVFLDVEMPGMNGMTLAGKILEVSPHTNLIFITGYGEYALEAYEYYASSFIMKPVNQAKLKDALNHLRYPVSSLTDEIIEANFSGKAPLGKRLEEIRERREISRKELAEKMDVSVQTVYRWESGDRVPDVVTFMKLAKVLGVTLDELTS